MKVRWIAAAALLVSALGFAGDEAPKPESAGGNQILPAGGDVSRSDASAGTAGRELIVPPMRSAVRVAIVGSLMDADLKKLAGELNEVAADIVMTTGDFGDAKRARERLNQLQMPWYPCVGKREAGIGESYTRNFGPRYFSVDAGDVHLISLDSEENAEVVTLSDAQLIWLAKDLDKAFRRARHVAVVMHRPAWRDTKSNWEKVHRMLVAFGQRPVVAIEGQPNSNVRGGKVEAVFAAGSEYCEDDAKDGIRYVTAGPVKGTGSAATGRMGQYVIARIGEGGIGVSVAETGRVHSANLVTRAFREAMEKIEKPGVISVEGSVEYSPGKESGTLRAAEGTAWLQIENPLDVPLTVKARVAEESAWKMSGAESAMKVLPRETLKVRIGLFTEASTREVSPPEILFSASFEESGREVEMRRPVKVERVQAEVEKPK
jgi:hypothetical protein